MALFELFDFRLWDGRAVSRDGASFTPQVFTPPRDDFAGTSPYGMNAGLSEKERSLQQTLVTRQAFCLLFRAASFFIGSLVSGFILYTFVNWFVGEAKVLNCPEQPILNGYIMPGHVGSPAKVHCAGNYSLGAPLLGIKCRMVSEKCVIKKHATVMKEAVRKCDRKYAFVSKAIEEKVLLHSRDKLNYSKIEEEDIPHACMSNSELGLRPARLYDDHTAALPTRSWPSPFSIMTIAGLVLMPVILLVTAGVMQGRAPPIRRRGYPADPDWAEDEVVLLDMDEDSIAREISVFR